MPPLDMSNMVDSEGEHEEPNLVLQDDEDERYTEERPRTPDLPNPDEQLDEEDKENVSPKDSELVQNRTALFEKRLAGKRYPTLPSQEQVPASTTLQSIVVGTRKSSGKG